MPKSYVKWTGVNGSLMSSRMNESQMYSVMTGFVGIPINSVKLMYRRLSNTNQQSL